MKEGEGSWLGQVHGSLAPSWREEAQVAGSRRPRKPILSCKQECERAGAWPKATIAICQEEIESEGGEHPGGSRPGKEEISL